MPAVNVLEAPVTVTVMPLPTFLSAKVPEAPERETDTRSPATTPDTLAPEVLSVAVVVASYTLLLAVNPVTVSGAGVMLAVTPWACESV